jgi:O-acetyl-ADP-ribose deacetylase (regulator of RNase III)
MAPIEHHTGDLLAADAEALVNTVNTVGVMGKGVALQFKHAFPDNYAAYRRACKAEEVLPGRMFVFEPGQLTGPRLIINFPTKRHWKGKARIGDIEAGLADLVEILRRFEIRSVAIPPLGCGNGGLLWSSVRPLIEESLADVDAKVLLYAPAPPPPAIEQPSRTKRAPRMTRTRAALLAVFGAYRADPGVSLTRLVAQKLAYLLQVDGEPLDLEFEKGEYGPYADTLKHVLRDLDGTYIKGYDEGPKTTNIRLEGDAESRAQAFLANTARSKEHVERVRRLIDGFESPFGLELLTTVHWAVSRESARTPTEALAVVAEWTPRKRDVFKERDVAIAWERLRSEGWLDAPASDEAHVGDGALADSRAHA